MAEAKLKEVEKTPVQAIKVPDLKEADAMIARFSIILPKGVGLDDVENPALYSNIASRVPIESEIRLNAEDGSFVAWVYVSYSYGNDLRAHLIHSIQLDDVTGESNSSNYEAKLCGRDKWCIIDTRDGSRLKQNIATKIQCLQDIADHETAMKN